MRVVAVLTAAILVVAVSAEVPPLSGLLSRGFSDPKLSGWNPELLWSQLEPSPGKFNFNKIDEALNKGKPIRLRVWAGIYAPAHLKKKLGTVKVMNDQTKAIDTMIPYWKKSVAKKYWAAYKKLQVALAKYVKAKNSDLIRGIQISGTMFVYSEPFLHQFGQAYTIKNVLKAKWTPKADKAAQMAMLKIHAAVWPSLPQVFAFNIYQSLKKSTVKMDPSYTSSFLSFFRKKFGRRAVIGNHSIRETYIGEEKDPSKIYYHMKKAGKPLYFQTATWERIHKLGDKASEAQRHDALVRVLNWAISLGAHAVELPFGHTLSDAEIASFDQKLKANA